MTWAGLQRPPLHPLHRRCSSRTPKPKPVGKTAARRVQLERSPPLRPREVAQSVYQVRRHECEQQNDWRCRREEIRRLAEKYALGTKPPPPEQVTGSVTGTQITVQVTDGGKSSSFTATVKLPSTGQAPYPAIIAYVGGIGGVDGQSAHR